MAEGGNHMQAGVAPAFGVRAKHDPAWLKALILIGCLAFAPGADAHDALTTGQLEALAPAAANRTVRNDLLSVLQPVDRISSGMRVQLPGVQLVTHPYGTQFVGLCREDAIWLKYAPTDLAPGFRDRPLQPYGVEAQAIFHAVDIPQAIVAGRDSVAAVWDEHCERIEASRSAFWFTALNADVAAKAVNLLKAATDRVRVGALKPKTCELLPTEKRTCEQTILDEGDIGKITSVDACSSGEGMECYVLEVGGMTRFTIVGRIRPTDVAPTTVESIIVEQYLTVT